MIIRPLTFLLFFALLVTGCQADAPNDRRGRSGEVADGQSPSTIPQAQPIEVVFVCQYGYAKSLVASRHFERMAAAKGLPVQVIARGITPSENVSEAISEALRGDGFEVAGFQPRAIQADEIATAKYIISFGNEVPEGSEANRLDWSGVSALSENYPKARDEIVVHLTELLEEIETSEEVDLAS